MNNDVRFVALTLKTIGPGDVLGLKTPVRVGNLIGHVVFARMVPACNGGMVCSHTIRFTARRERGFGTEYKTVAIKPRTMTVNYASIYILESDK